MSKANQLHEKAMELADQAFIARRAGKTDTAVKLSKEALKHEAAAAHEYKDNLSAEPTRSVLYRSAASLALLCGDYRAAERHISAALAGEPPEELADELRDLLEQAHFTRHLALHEVHLAPGEIQLAIAGKAVGYGITLSDVLVERLKDLERMVYRFVERKGGRPFREHGSSAQAIQERYSLYLAAPRAGSFALTLRIGQQMQLPGLDLSSEVVDELLECLELFNDGKDAALREKIPQEPYYRNFMGLAKRLAPDGERVTMVGLTAVKDGKERPLAITRKQKSSMIQAAAKEEKVEVEKEHLSVTGRLLRADGTKSRGKIQLIDGKGEPHSVYVPEGMMSDIVRPLWDYAVTVTGSPYRQGILLEEITPEADESPQAGNAL